MPQQQSLAALTRLNSSWASLHGSQCCPAVDSVNTLPHRSTAHSTELGMAAGAEGRQRQEGEVSGHGRSRTWPRGPPGRAGSPR